MNIKDIIAWCIAHPELAVVAAGALLSIPGAVYALVKTAYQAITGRPAKGPAWTVLDVVVEVLPNLPGAINRVVRGAGLPSIFAPPAAPPPAPSKVPAPIQREGERGSARVGAVAFVLAVGLCLAGLGATLAGCPKVIREPALPPPPDGCDAGATLCHQGAPWRCGPGGHWSQADRRCDRLGAADASVVCCPSPSALRPSALVHACVPPTACSPEVSR